MEEKTLQENTINCLDCSCRMFLVGDTDIMKCPKCKKEVHIGYGD